MVLVGFGLVYMMWLAVEMAFLIAGVFIAIIAFIFGRAAYIIIPLLVLIGLLL